MYTLPLSEAVFPPGVVQIVKNHTGLGAEKGLGHNASLRNQVYYQELEGKLVQLVGSKTLHWRHQEMAVGMLLSMITYDHTPSLSTTSLLRKSESTIRSRDCPGSRAPGALRGIARGPNMAPSSSA